jgi:hypothetical protein
LSPRERSCGPSPASTPYRSATAVLQFTILASIVLLNVLCRLSRLSWILLGFSWRL